MSLARDFGFVLNSIVHTDSTAAMGMVHRRGTGRTRHLDVQYLWLQEKVNNKTLRMAKVDTKLNLADLMTKNLPAEAMMNHLTAMGVRFVGGRADSAPSLKTIVSINENGSPLAPIGEDVSKTPSYSGSSKDNRRN
jgi:hypothetical protein